MGDLRRPRCRGRRRVRRARSGRASEPGKTLPPGRSAARASAPAVPGHVARHPGPARPRSACSTAPRRGRCVGATRTWPSRTASRPTARARAAHRAGGHLPRREPQLPQRRADARPAPTGDADLRERAGASTRADRGDVRRRHAAHGPTPGGRIPAGTGTASAPRARSAAPRRGRTGAARRGTKRRLGSEMLHIWFTRESAQRLRDPRAGPRSSAQSACTRPSAAAGTSTTTITASAAGDQRRVPRMSRYSRGCTISPFEL